MKTRRLWPWMVLLASFAFVLQASTIAKAQDDVDQQPQVRDQDQDQDQDQSPDQDPPGRVARLNYSHGTVSFRPSGEDEWVTSVPNRPMVNGDDLWADDDSRAEVHIGSAAIRLGSKTGITFLTMDDRTTQIRLAQGSLMLRVRHVDDDDTFEIDTPNIAFSLLQPGTYRIDVSEDGSRTVTTVWQGRGRVTGGGFSYTVVAKQSASFTGNEDHLDYDLAQIPRRDDFDRWAFERDDREDHADSANYVSREMTGYEDLDEYGQWSYVAGYGPCWRPRSIVVGWAPYRYGHWVYISPWGWTWVDDEPWGFAPFHYGRWAFVGGGWYWVPGPVVVRPVWAPALVAFVGGRPGFHFSAGVGVGWFPLAPGEVYVPGYRVSRRYVNNVNITNTNVNITKVTNVYNTTVINRTTTVNNITYVNQRMNNGVTVVSHETFVNARPVSRNVMRVEPREVVAAPVSRSVMVEPVRTSVIGAGRPVQRRPPVSVISRPVVVVRTPPAPVRPIEQRQKEAGGRLNEQVLVRPVAPARPIQMNQEGRPQVKPMPQTPSRVYEQQGTSQPDNRSNVHTEDSRPVTRTPQPQPGRTVMDSRSDDQEPARNVQPTNRDFRAPQREDVKPAPQERNPLVHSAPPERERNDQQERQQEQKFHQWQQQRPATPPTVAPQRQQPSRPEPPKQDKPARQDKPSRSDKPNRGR